MTTLFTPRVTLVMFAILLVVSTGALTLGGISLTRAGIVSVLPVTSQQSGIAVCGHGKATAKPDQARISLGVFATAPSAQAARDLAARVMNDVLAALKSGGVADQDIQTGYLSLQPQYNYNSGSPHMIGYSATNTVTATIRAVENAGKVIDAVTDRGGNNILINGIQFSNGDPAQARIAAQKDAVADAKRQAEQVAASAGASLGQAMSIQVGGCGNTTQPPIYYDNKGVAGTSISTPIQPGQLDVTVDVAVVYALR
ncbi:MAG TPA: SIMPL domain-containing protein [Ktedonobacterales bacterium]